MYRFKRGDKVFYAGHWRKIKLIKQDSVTFLDGLTAKTSSINWKSAIIKHFLDQLTG